MKATQPKNLQNPYIFLNFIILPVKKLKFQKFF